MSRVIGYRMVSEYDQHMNREQAERMVRAYGPAFRVAELREVGACVWTPIDGGFNTICGVTGVEVTYEHGTDSTTFCPFCGGHIEAAA